MPRRVIQVSRPSYGVQALGVQALGVQAFCVQAFCVQARRVQARRVQDVPRRTTWDKRPSRPNSRGNSAIWQFARKRFTGHTP